MDCDNDGYVEVYVVLGSDLLCIEKGVVQWTLPIANESLPWYSFLRASDVDADGVPEILTPYVCETTTIAAIDPIEQRVEWIVDLPNDFAYSLPTDIVVDDLDGDGSLELVCIVYNKTSSEAFNCTWYLTVFCLSKDVPQLVWRTSLQPLNFTISNPTVFDINQDGYKEILVYGGYMNPKFDLFAYLFCFSYDGVLLWSKDLGYVTLMNWFLTPVVADVYAQNPGYEVAVARGCASLYVLSANGSLLFDSASLHYVLSSSRTPLILRANNRTLVVHTASCCAALCYPCAVTLIACYDPTTSQLYWRREFTPTSGATAIDVDGDGALDVVAAGDKLLAFSLSDSTLLWQYKYPCSDPRCAPPPVPADVDGDGYLELLLTSHAYSTDDKWWAFLACLDNFTLSIDELRVDNKTNTVFLRWSCSVPARYELHIYHKETGNETVLCTTSNSAAIQLVAGHYVLNLTAYDVFNNTVTRSIPLELPTKGEMLPVIVVRYPPTDPFYTNKSCITLRWTIEQGYSNGTRGSDWGWRSCLPLNRWSYSNNTSVACINIYLDGSLVATLPPSATNFTLCNLSGGSHLIILEAVDAVGRLFSTLIKIIVDQTPPWLFIKSPSNGSQCAEGVVTVSWDAHDNFGIAYCLVYVNRQLVENTTGPYIVSLKVKAGNTYIVQVVAVDKAGNTATQRIVFYAIHPTEYKPTKPILKITLPTIILATLILITILLVAIIAPYRRKLRF